MKRLLIVLLIALFCLSLLAGCGPKKEQPKEEMQTEEAAQQVAPESGQVIDTTQPAVDTTQPSGK